MSKISIVTGIVRTLHRLKRPHAPLHLCRGGRAFFAGLGLTAALVPLLAAIPLLVSFAKAESAQVLILMDEREQMEELGRYLKENGQVESQIADQLSLPGDWSGYRAAVVYIHGKLNEATEVKLIDYTKGGGRLILLHHTISSGKARNRYLFGFLGIELSDPDKAREPSIPGGHYAWKDPIDQQIINLRPGSFLTSHGIVWPESASYASSDQPSVEREYPCVTLRDSEAYVNHKFTDGRSKSVLLGFKWRDERNGQLYEQDRAGWYKKQGKGWVFYLSPGHSTAEFRNPVLAQLVLNAVVWSPDMED
jgi:hypothetical protein